jgi:hypothetical protein
MGYKSATLQATRRRAHGAIKNECWLNNLPILHMQGPVAHAGEFFVMGDYKKGLAHFIAQAHKKFMQFFGIGAVEVAGRLIGKYDGRVIDQRPGHGHPLLFAAG